MEKVANAGSANANEHFGKFGTGNREKRNVSFASNGASHQGFTSSWIASEKDATRNFCTESFVFFRVFKKVDDFLKVLFR